MLRRPFRTKTLITSLLLFIMIATTGGITTSCSPKVCPANSKQVFNKKRARYSTMNHMKRRKMRFKRKKSRTRDPEYKFFRVRFKKRQFRHQTK